jgi:predicted lipid-binding transport protein (Tim44 family)
MNFRIIFFSTILTISAILSGCGRTETTSNKNVSTNTPTNAPVTNGNLTNQDVIKTTTPTPEATTNDAPTLMSVFKAYCDAKTKGDEAGLRKVYSAKTLQQFEKEMKEEGEESLVKYLEVDKVSTKMCEIRNEKIEGDTAVAEIKTEGMPNGIKVKFVKENGEWKLTTEIPDFENMKKSAANSNTAK